MSIHPSSLQNQNNYILSEARKRVRKKNEALLAYGFYELMPLDCLGYPRYVLTIDGKVFKVDEFSENAKELKQPRRGASKRKSVTLKNKDATVQYFLHILVAWAFVPRQKTTSYSVFFIDGNSDNVHAENLSWEPVNEELS